MRIAIHIGLHKTGSTALQNGLFRGRKALEAMGVIYPEAHVIWDAHHVLAWSLLGSRRAQYNGVPADEIVTSWLREAADHKADTMVISSEDFEFLSSQQVQKLRAQLGELEGDVYFYVRPQHDYLVAEYKQHVRMAETAFSGPIEQFYYRFALNTRFNYFQTANRWAEVFGKDRVHITVYDRQSMTGQDIVSDFADCAELPALDGGYPRENRNLSWSNLTAVVMSRLNQLGIKAELREALAARIESIVTKQNLSIELLTPEAIKALDDCYRESNRQLIAKFRPRGNLDRLFGNRAAGVKGDTVEGDVVVKILLLLTKDLFA